MRTHSEKATDLVKLFESLSLVAYPDPGNPETGDPYTIGYGHTGSVRPNDSCTQAQADIWLERDMRWAAKGVNEALTCALNQEQFDALVSFAFNVGTTALKESTLARRLNNGEDPNTVISEELPRWINGASGPMPGLVRRRKAEIALATSGQAIDVKEKENAIDLVQAAKYFKGLPHQEVAFQYIQSILEEEELAKFAELYRNAGPKKEHDPEEPLQVPYFFQLDSHTDQAARMCFSSTNAMLLEYLKPGSIKIDHGDDEFLRRVNQYGDTTEASAQVKALESYGIECEMRYDGSWDTLRDELAKGNPIPVGWLHKGNENNPSGGGHWSLVVAIDETHVTLHDPFGEASMTWGGYVSNDLTAGRFIKYTRQRFGKRWMVEGSGSGWYIRVI